MSNQKTNQKTNQKQKRTKQTRQLSSNKHAGENTKIETLTPEQKIVIVKEFRDVKTNDATLRLKFRADENGERKNIQFDVPRSILNSDADLYRMLLGKGYRGSRKHVKDQIDSLIEHPPKNGIPSTHQTGLINGALVTRYPNLRIAPKDGLIVTPIGYKDSPPSDALRKGNIKRCLLSLEPLLSNSTELTFAYLVGLAAPLGVLLELQEGFVVVAYGETSTGKTSLCKLVQSLSTIATDDKHLDGFENTPGRLLKSTIQTAGLVRSFGDVKTSRDGVNFEDFRNYGYSIAEGRYRQPMDDDRGDITLDYSIQLYATEDPIWEMPSKRKEAFQLSDLVRLIHIPIESQDNGGIFRNVPKPERASKFKKFDAALKANYGVVMPRWLKKLAKQDVEKLKDLHKNWMKKDFVAGADIRKEQIRIARTFNYLLFVARLADRFGLLPIDFQTAERNLREQFERVIRCGPNMPSKSQNFEKQVINALTAAILIPYVQEKKRPEYELKKPLGFIRRGKDGKLYIFVHQGFIDMFGTENQNGIKDFIKGLSVRDGATPVKNSGFARRRYYKIPVSALGLNLAEDNSATE